MVTERTVTSDHCHFSTEVFQVLHTLTQQQNYSWCCQWSTELDPLFVTSMYCIPVADWTLPSAYKIPARYHHRTSPWFACKSDNLPHMSEQVTQAVDKGKKKKNPQPTWRGYRCWKFKWRLLLLISLLQEKQISLLNPLSSGNINTLGVPEIMQLTTLDKWRD